MNHWRPVVVAQAECDAIEERRFASTSLTMADTRNMLYIKKVRLSSNSQTHVEQGYSDPIGPEFGQSCFITHGQNNQISISLTNTNITVQT